MTLHSLLGCEGPWLVEATYLLVEPTAFSAWSSPSPGKLPSYRDQAQQDDPRIRQAEDDVHGLALQRQWCSKTAAGSGETLLVKQSVILVGLVAVVLMKVVAVLMKIRFCSGFGGYGSESSIVQAVGIRGCMA